MEQVEGAVERMADIMVGMGHGEEAPLVLLVDVTVAEIVTVRRIAIAKKAIAKEEESEKLSS